MARRCAAVVAQMGRSAKSTDTERLRSPSMQFLHAEGSRDSGFAEDMEVSLDDMDVRVSVEGPAAPGVPPCRP